MKKEYPNKPYEAPQMQKIVLLAEDILNTSKDEPFFGEEDPTTIVI